MNIEPEGILAAQFEGLPLPLPIREPITFLVMGICGNAFTHKYRLVIFDRRTVFLRNIFIQYENHQKYETPEMTLHAQLQHHILL